MAQDASRAEPPGREGRDVIEGQHVLFTTRHYSCSVTIRCIPTVTRPLVNTNTSPRTRHYTSLPSLHVTKRHYRRYTLLRVTTRHYTSQHATTRHCTSYTSYKSYCVTTLTTRVTHQCHRVGVYVPRPQIVVASFLLKTGVVVLVLPEFELQPGLAGKNPPLQPVHCEFDQTAPCHKLAPSIDPAH